LYWEAKSLPGDRATKKVQEFIWEKFRRDLGRHFDPKDIEFFGPLEIDHLARDVYSSSPEIFWDITKAILECADTRRNADLVDSLVQQLLHLTPDELRAGLDLADRVGRSSTIPRDARQMTVQNVILTCSRAS
jgi:hypothetical protein